jgi:lysophospholipase L1-like esterase
MPFARFRPQDERPQRSMIWRMLLVMPLVLPQAVWLALRARRLPEASGPRAGAVGKGPLLRVLVLGDSSAAGVGATDQSEALAGCLARGLASHFSVEWTLVARSGATLATLLSLLNDHKGGPYDLAVIAIGVNDAKNGGSLRRWRRDYTTLLDLLEARFRVGHVYASGLPPVRRFPIFAWPLRDVLAERFALFDQALRGLAAQRPLVRHIAMDFASDPRDMAADGLHPGPGIYAIWAGVIAARIRNDLVERRA